MRVQKLRCTCGWEGEASFRCSCPECGDSLDVCYDYTQADREKVDRALSEFHGVWDFAELLPVQKPESIVSLHEGGTPLIPSAQDFPCRVFWKDETRNPTLSFKDRPNTVGISVAKEYGFRDVSIASTGNGAASLATYAVRAGMRCHICAPRSTPMEKIVQPMYCGADIILCDGDYSSSYRRNRELSEQNGWANLTSTYLNPFTLEGDKTIAYEIFAQCGRNVPDWIVVPLGAGPMLTGIYKGFSELRTLGFCDRLPRMVGVQASGCAPIVNAWIAGEQTVRAWGQCTTACGAIADALQGYERDGTRTLQTIYRSGGVGVAVTDTETVFEMKRLARFDTLLAEPASATPAAAIRRLCADGTIGKNDVAIGIVTAHGLKDAEYLQMCIKEEPYETKG